MLFEGVVDGDHAPLPCSFTAACRLTPAHPRRPPTHDAGRPPFRARNREEAERFFVDSLDAWRREQGLDKMVLMGELRSVSACLHGSTALSALMCTIEQASAWLWVHGCRKRAGGWQRRLLLPGQGGAGCRLPTCHSLSWLSSFAGAHILPNVVPLLPTPGHSMGGYLSACYAMHHPERVQHLILMVGRLAGMRGQYVCWTARWRGGTHACGKSGKLS